MDEALEALLARIAVPLIAIDEATLYVVAASPEHVHLHLGGAYAGCPGNPFVEQSLLAPLVREVHPRASLTVTSGLPVPKAAKRLRQSGASATEMDTQERLPVAQEA